MKHRIEALLDKLQLSPSKFADELGIQRSGMSHILSGRNNPSLDLIQKILNRYPDVSMDYLIQGKGPVLLADKVAEVEKTLPIQEAIAPTSVTPKPIESAIQPTVIVVEEPPVLISSNPITPLEPRPQLALFDIPPTSQPAKVLQQTVVEKPLPVKKAEPISTPKPIITNEKKIKRIVIFYEDNTFSAYTPED